MKSTHLAGLWRHFVLTLVLNTRSGRALAYGYLMPVLFLLAFGGIFRGENPPLQHELGQLITITILGGACFGLPTALVSERERGIWRRYRLLPIPTVHLVTMTLVARLMIVASAVVLQCVLARLVYGTPWPSHPLQTVLAFGAVSFAFLGLGLLITALAEDVPAVQALGQCLFLPMILIGGVGVPLIALPPWAQVVAGFMPGRYAVEVLQRAMGDPGGLRGTAFDFVALGAIGVAAGWVGARLFRWDNVTTLNRRARLSVVLALGTWGAVGAVALVLGRLEPVTSNSGYAEITDADVLKIRFDDLPGDNELVTRLAPPFPSGKPPPRVAEIAASLKTWPAARTGDIVDDVRALVCVAAIADIGADTQEAEIGRMVFDELEGRYRHALLRRVLTWIVLHPQNGRVVTEAPELDLRRGRPSEEMVRERVALYAKKYLGRLTGKISAP
jgi:ABC-2 type transport system permease protein